ncbi:energy-coupling factor ABC transporter ATP-binding protein [Plantibacter sp. Mn2098]|uniref:energy-coupling factor ABC transporter ATP-binding protein n=1 Tax=Plantibacter sp. Mn2098 TaxID=3395266 RepID=UPI003BC7081E
MSIDVQNVVFRYPDGTTALEDVSLSFGAGERVAVVGQNGAGKTTLAKLMNGLLTPTEGRVVVNGVSTADQTTAMTARTVGYVFQNPDDQIFASTVEDELEYMPRYFKWNEEKTSAKLGRAVELTGIEEYLDVNPSDLPFAIKKFVAIATVIVNDCDYVILDEPTAGLDAIGTERLVDLVRELSDSGVGVITITHDMRFVADAFPRVVVMANRRLVMDGSAQTSSPPTRRSRPHGFAARRLRNCSATSAASPAHSRSPRSPGSWHESHPCPNGRRHRRRRRTGIDPPPVHRRRRHPRCQLRGRQRVPRTCCGEHHGMARSVQRNRH